ncbi:MAG: UDP-N-acetylmuramoyl-tripeptide--D-alanyl-D-alanine ligase [Proteobacteria bacterium]|nr:UDP-N-acetylmuramoyl-tripeptide--D-alanyl-D-alanine ligase [Pseudomonadota bacterium]
MKRTLADFAKACGGKLHGVDREYNAVSSDTRTLAGGDFFIALRGPRYNANEFVVQASSAGAAGALVDTLQPVAIPQVVVPDTQIALEKAGHAWRTQFSIPVVGVAGSNGKTTAKEMTAAILGAAGECLATRGNLNNHIGVPLTLFRIESKHRFAVVEMGANAAGEVAHLVEIGRPTVGLITNAGAEHLEGFGSIEGVARAEGEMVAGLKPDATAVINADDQFADLWRASTPARVVTFGVQKAADFTATDLKTSVGPDGFLTRFNLTSPLGEVAIELRMGGRHNVANALAAAAAATAAGAKLEHVAQGLGAVRAVAGRLQFKMTATGAWLIDDSYNANPSSMEAGIEVLAGLDGRKWLVMGDMAELGDFAASSHSQIGVFAREHGIERLFAVGQLAALAVESFGRGGQWFSESTALADALKGAPADVRMLIKGSRVNRLERVVDALVAPSTTQAGKR